MKGFTSPIVKKIKAGKGYTPKKGFAAVIYLCQKCGNTVGIHEIYGENYKPPYCPHCHSKNLTWEKVYRADASGRIID